MNHASFPASATGESAGRTGTVWWILSISAFALFVSTTLWFFFSSAFGGQINSDSAVSVLLADEILRTGEPFPKTWYFVNGEIWTFGPQFFALPFVAALGPSPLALKLANLAALCAMLWFIALPIRRMTQSWPFAVLVASGTLACYSALQVLMIHGQPAYGWFSAQFALLIYLSLRLQDDPQGEATRPNVRRRWLLVAYVLVLLNLVIESPLRAAAYWIVPFLAVSIAFPISRQRANASILATGAIAVVGLALRHVTAGHLLINPGLAATFVRPPEFWGTNIANVIDGLPVMVGYASAWWPISTLPGALSVARISFLAIAAGAVALAVPLGRRMADVESRFVARLVAATLALTLAILIVGKLAVDYGVIRYLLPSAILCLAAFMTLLWCRWGARDKRMIAVAVIYVVIFCAGAAPFVSRWAARAASPQCDAPSDPCRLQAALLRNGLHKGYATYWNANVMTLASKGSVVACGIELLPQLRPRRALVAKRCFDRPGDARYFIALTTDEIRRARRESLTADIGRPDQVVVDGKFEIWIYETAKSNLAWLDR